ncbi:hypothetical protein EZV62_028015 [Acer yangbiense]|uniref:TLC domain-containing protein n=1 Tax=Acer yangbiense TaxID=1000413 RepID=A0A5C7GPK2_9ROSI|nr:hypothetical protein EZV62_028015 [Acer yangbiense]
MTVISATIFAGILLSAAAEISETRWFWRRNKTTPLRWLLCFRWVRALRDACSSGHTFSTCLGSSTCGGRSSPFSGVGSWFWTGIGLPGACFSISLQLPDGAARGCNLVCHVGVLRFHFMKGGGCNGIGAWLFNSVLNAAILLPFMKFYVKMVLEKRKNIGFIENQNQDAKFTKKIKEK